jgi:hypothetical protein
MENLKISNVANSKASLCFKCIICSNFQDIPYFSNKMTPICDECLFDLKYYVETRRPKP